MSDYQIVRRILLSERRRRATYYRYRPTERAAMDKEMADALAALERLRQRAEWGDVGKFWQDKFG